MHNLLPAFLYEYCTVQAVRLHWTLRQIKFRVTAPSHTFKDPFSSLDSETCYPYGSSSRFSSISAGKFR